MSEVSVDLDLSQFDRTLKKVLRGLKDGEPLARLIGEEMTLAVDDRFRDEVDPDGSPWAELSPKYVEYKRRKGFITKKLQMRGNMRARVAYEAYSDRVVIGTDVPYARRQQEKRPFLYDKNERLGARDRQRVEKVTEDYLQSLVDG